MRRPGLNYGAGREMIARHRGIPCLDVPGARAFCGNALAPFSIPAVRGARSDAGGHELAQGTRSPRVEALREVDADGFERGERRCILDVLADCLGLSWT